MLRLIILIIIIGLITACSGNQSKDTVKMVLNKEMYQMNRQEVINAIEDCRSVKLRPVLYHGRIKVTERYVPIVVDVQCAPTYKDYN
jgi:hypothetical protein|tara:strand:- start:68 stop:328 length:261 start_codon:yes stop_codon:yes gene_type:complete